jgi:hypothetical protein
LSLAALSGGEKWEWLKRSKSVAVWLDEPIPKVGEGRGGW